MPLANLVIGHIVIGNLLGVPNVTGTCWLHLTSTGSLLMPKIHYTRFPITST